MDSFYFTFTERENEYLCNRTNLSGPLWKNKAGWIEKLKEFDGEPHTITPNKNLSFVAGQDISIENINDDDTIIVKSK